MKATHTTIILAAVAGGAPAFGGSQATFQLLQVSSAIGVTIDECGPATFTTTGA